MRAGEGRLRMEESGNIEHRTSNIEPPEKLKN
jgi:hypothetical protein